jgi:Fe2+ or Zn2+ uptake regulation protein
MDTDVHVTVASRLRRAGQRYTGARRALVDTLGTARRPLTVAEVLGSSPLSPVSTIYRNLAVLTQAGVLHRFPGADSARFELAEDLTEHHHHLVCTTCGQVEDCTLTAATERAVTAALQGAATTSGFAIESHRLDALGRCANCR